MNPRVRWALRIVGAMSLVSAGALWWHSYVTAKDSQAVARGEEVYASHDCTDCHLSSYELKQKLEKKEAGLIRARRNLPELRQFLATDSRHRSYTMMAESDRDDLLIYLRNQLP